MLHALELHGPVCHLVVAPMTHSQAHSFFALTITGSTHILLYSVEPASILAAIEAGRVQITFKTCV